MSGFIRGKSIEELRKYAWIGWDAIFVDHRVCAKRELSRAVISAGIGQGVMSRSLFGGQKNIAPFDPRHLLLGGSTLKRKQGVGVGEALLWHIDDFINPFAWLAGVLHAIKFGLFSCIEHWGKDNGGLHLGKVAKAGVFTAKAVVESINWLVVLPLRLLTLPGKMIERACNVFAHWNKATTLDKSLAVTGVVLGAAALITACIFAPVLIPLVAKGLASMVTHVFGMAALSAATKTVAAKACLWATVGLNGLKAVASAARSAFAWFKGDQQKGSAFTSSMPSDGTSSSIDESNHIASTDDGRHNEGMAPGR